MLSNTFANSASSEGKFMKDSRIFGPDRPPIAKALIEQRLKLNKTQHDISEQLGYSSPQFISNWERGIAKPPINSLRQVAKAYKMPVTDLIELFVTEHRAYLMDIAKVAGD